MSLLPHASRNLSLTPLAAALIGCGVLPEDAKPLTEEQHDIVEAFIDWDGQSDAVVDDMIDAMDSGWATPQGPTDDPKAMKTAIHETRAVLVDIWKHDRFLGATTKDMPLKEGEAMEIDLNRIDNDSSDVSIVLNVDVQDVWAPGTLMHEAGHLRFAHDGTIEGEILNDTDQNWRDPNLSTIILDHHDYSYLISALYVGPTSILEKAAQERQDLFDAAVEHHQRINEFKDALTLPEKETWIHDHVSDMLSWNAFPETAGISADILEASISRHGWYEHEVELRAELLEAYREGKEAEMREHLKDLRITPPEFHLK